MDQPKKKVDRHLGMKYMGYKLSQLPKTYYLKDLVRYAKFQLAHRNKILLKDPIWDEYTIEELLVEFYAHQFQESKEFRQAFEQSLGETDDYVEAFSKWADQQMAEDAKIREQTLGETEDKVSFSPSDVMGED